MRRTIILFFIALILVAIAAVVAFVFVPGGNSGNGAGEERPGLFGSLFPFNFNQGGEQLSGEPRDGGAIVDTRPVPLLRQVTDAPTSGAFVYENGEGKVLIRYIDRATGHVYEVPAEGRSAVRISNTTIPGIQEALFASANEFIIRYLNEKDDVENFHATLAPDTEEQTIDGSFLDSWDRGVVDPAGKTLMALYETNQGSVATLSDIDGSNERTVFTSPITSWVPLQSNAGVYVLSAPSPGVPGFLYRVVNGTLNKVAGDLPGMLATISPSGRYVLVSSQGREAALYLYDTRTNERYESPLPTLAEKCAFVSETPVQVACGVPQEFPRGAYPNDWLLGKARLSDDLWLIEPVGGVATLAAIPVEDAGIELDVWKPVVDAEGGYFTFLNKNDLSLWSLRLREQPQEADEDGASGE